MSGPVTNLLLTNVRILIPGTSSITCPNLTSSKLTNVNVNSTGKKGIFYNFNAAPLTITNMIIKAPWSLPDAFVGSTIRPTITGGTAWVIDAVITEVKNNGSISITGKYKIVNPIITGWDTTTPRKIIELVSNEVTGNNGQLNYENVEDIDVSYTGSGINVEGCTWTYPGTTNTGSHFYVNNLNLTTKSPTIVRPDVFKLTGTDIRVTKFTSFDMTGTGVALIVNDDGDSTFTLDVAESGLKDLVSKSDKV